MAHLAGRLTGRDGALSVKKIAALCCAGGFLDGYDLLIMGSALLLLVPEFGLDGATTGLITALPYIGAALGAVVSGRLNDRFGRRLIYLFDVVLFLVLAVLLCFAQEVWQLALLRFLVGIAIGFDMPTGSSMLAEFSPPRKRGLVTAMMNTSWLAGGAVAALVGYLLYSTVGEGAWRWMFLSAALPAVIILAARATLPESPYWLRSIGRTAEAEDIERRLPAEVVAAAQTPRSSQRGNFRDVFSRRYRGRVAFFAVYWMWQAFFSAAPFTYTALIFSSIILLDGGDALLLSASLLTAYVIFSLVCQFFVLDRFGRKPLAVVSCLVAGATGIPIALLQDVPVALVVFYAISLVATQMATIPFWPWSVEQLPTRIRATGQSIGSAGNKLGLFVSLLIFPPPVIAAIGWKPMFFGYAFGFLGLALFAAVLGRETKDADLSTIDTADGDPRATAVAP
jgi:putative MFS transporter